MKEARFAFVMAALLAFSQAVHSSPILTWVDKDVWIDKDDGNLTEEEQRQLMRETIEPTLATKRPYPVPETLPPQPAQCTLEHINHLGRHGSRYPGDNKVTNKDYLLPAREIGLLDETVGAQLTTKGEQLRDILEQQEALYTLEKTPAGEITTQGEQELAGIAERMIAGSGLSKTEFLQQLTRRSGKALSTVVHRTQTSRTAFLESWQRELNTPQLNLSIQTPTINSLDTELQFYQVCGQLVSGWKSSVQNHKEEINAAINSTKNQRRLGNFVRFFITGLTPQQERSFGRLAYNWCTLDANQNYNLGLCALFTEAPDYQAVFKAYGQTDNLSHFYGRGPALELNNINRDSAIELLNSFLIATGNATRNPEAPFADLRFAHESTILRFQQILGLVTHENTTSASGAVTWDSSVLSPMSANIIWQTYSCTNPETDTHTNRVRMLVNEQVTPFPIAECQDESGLCDWDSVEQHYRQQYEGVALIDVCGEISAHFTDSSRINR